MKKTELFGMLHFPVYRENTPHHFHNRGRPKFGYGCLHFPERKLWVAGISHKKV
jgi:hypothetical protein